MRRVITIAAILALPLLNGGCAADAVTARLAKGEDALPDMWR